MDFHLRAVLTNVEDAFEELDELRGLYELAKERIEELEEEVADLNNKLDIIDMEGL